MDSLVQQSVRETPPLRSFDQQAMDAYKQQSEFDYSSGYAAGPSWLGLFLFWLMSKIAELLGEANADWLVENFFNLVFIIILIFGVVLIIRMRYGPLIVGSGAGSGPAPVVPELQEEQDYEKLLQEALHAGDLKLATRYLYIKTLQGLHQQGLVKLMKWKTVLEYTEEIPSEKRPFFQKIGILFESTWYGNSEPSQQDFEEGISSSKQLIS